MTRDFKEKISSFFKNRSDLDPLVAQPGNLPGWMEQIRARSFEQVPDLNVTKRIGSPWDLLTGNVYLVAVYHLTAMVAIYSDEIILWLDDHSSVSDFGDFVERENLLDWLPRQKDQLLWLLVETKLNYLGQPRLIFDSSDIPQAKKKSLDARERLAEVARKISPPIYDQNLDGSVRLHFCIWTQIFGRIFTIDCSLSPGTAFSYDGKLLTEGVGDFFIPR